MCNWMVTSGHISFVGIGEYAADTTVEDCQVQFRIVGTQGVEPMCSGLIDSVSLRPLEVLKDLGQIGSECEIEFKTLEGWVPCVAIH